MRQYPPCYTRAYCSQTNSLPARVRFGNSFQCLDTTIGFLRRTTRLFLSPDDSNEMSKLKGKRWFGEETLGLLVVALVD